MYFNVFINSYLLVYILETCLVYNVEQKRSCIKSPFISYRPAPASDTSSWPDICLPLLEAILGVSDGLAGEKKNSGRAQCWTPLLNVQTFSVPVLLCPPCMPLPPTVRSSTSLVASQVTATKQNTIWCPGMIGLCTFIHSSGEQLPYVPCLF